MVSIFKGDRVKIAPHSDIFMMGERYGEVTSIGRKWIHVKGERSGRTFKFWKGGDSRETVTGTAPSHWAAFFINGDASGLDANEIAQAEGFADWLGAWPCSCGDSEFFAWTHDANRLGIGGATCVEYVGLVEGGTA